MGGRCGRPRLREKSLLLLLQLLLQICHLPLERHHLLCSHFVQLLSLALLSNLQQQLLLIQPVNDLVQGTPSCKHRFRKLRNLLLRSQFAH